MPARKNQPSPKSIAPSVIALDLGGSKLAGAIFSRNGTLTAKTVAPLEKCKGSDVGRLISGQLQHLLAIAAARKLNIRAVGVSVPGISYRETGKVWAPNIPGWSDYPLRDELAAAPGTKKIPVEIESDRACCILGETWRGAARGCKHAIFLAVGTGIGAGILVDGRVLRGAEDIAGAAGWLALSTPFRPGYTQCGCFESYASGVGIAKRARELLKKTLRYTDALKQIPPSDIAAPDVFYAYAKHDAIAARVLRDAVVLWGMAAANFVSLFNPEKIIFGGGIFGPALQFLPQIRTEAKKWAQPVSFRKVKFQGSQLAGNAALYGAAYLALSSLQK